MVTETPKADALRPAGKQGWSWCSRALEPVEVTSSSVPFPVGLLPALSWLLLSLPSPTCIWKQFFPWDGLGHVKSIPFSSGLPRCGPGLAAAQGTVCPQAGQLCRMVLRREKQEKAEAAGDEHGLWVQGSSQAQARGIWNPLKQIK